MDKFWKATTRLVAIPFRPKTSHVLAILNEARVALAMRTLDSLPVGYMGASRSCPISRGLSRMVGVTGVNFENEDQAFAVANAWGTEVFPSVQHSFVVSLPTVLARFIRDFDLGAYPALTQHVTSAPASTTRFSQPLVDAA